MTPRRRLTLLTLLLLLGVHTAVAAQAITTAAVQGTVAGQDSTPIADAVVELVNTATGQQWRVVTSGGGRYFVEDRRVAPCFFEVPHQVVPAASVRLPLHSRLSLTYVGRSQGPYTYVVEPGDANTGDVNADGINAIILDNFVGQDIVYVPRNVTPAGDISLVVRDEGTGGLVPAPAETYAELDPYIGEEKCLDRQRGRLMERNSCRNPWFGELNARLTKSRPTARGQSIEMSADLLNALALVKRSWGEYRLTTDQTDLPLLRLQGYDQANQRGIYELNLPMRSQVDDFASRWRLLLGLRYSF